MKRFLLFAGSTYYPSGGWADLANDDMFEGKVEPQHDTQEAAVAEAERWQALHETLGWWHVVDLQTGTIVAEQDF